MDVTDLKAGERAKILSVTCEEPLYSRLFSLGIKPKEEIELVKISLRKNTYLVRAHAILIAMRKEAAQCVKIERK